jgi:hypothetical protein
MINNYNSFNLFDKRVINTFKEIDNSFCYFKKPIGYIDLIIFITTNSKPTPISRARPSNFYSLSNFKKESPTITKYR